MSLIRGALARLTGTGFASPQTDHMGETLSVRGTSQDERARENPSSDASWIVRLAPGQVKARNRGKTRRYRVDDRGSVWSPARRYTRVHVLDGAGASAFASGVDQTLAGLQKARRRMESQQILYLDYHVQVSP